MRRSFLALLGLLPLAAKGQKLNSTACTPTVDGSGVICLGGIPNGTVSGGRMGRPKPKKGECPVCATMAPPYKRKTEREFYGTDVCLTRGEGNITFAVCDPPSKDKLVGLMEHATRCSHCNAAFFQDAEK